MAGGGVPARAQGEAAATGGPTRAEFSKLQADVQEQRQLIIQMMQNEQQRYDMLLRLIQTQGAGTASSAIAVPPATTLEPPVARETPGPAAAAAGSGAAGPEASRHARVGAASGETERKTGFVEGKVTLPAGEGGPIYVYVDGIRSSPVHGKSIEIRQEGRQFIPRVAVVQPGTSVLFPNMDTVYHNVFSNSPRNSFDLGSYRAGDKPRAVTLATPGVVEVFCNMHQKMSADILVVPNALYTQVRPNGSFRLSGIPVGQRQLVAWSPHAKPVQQKVEITASGAQASFVLDPQAPKAHVNKVGQAYGSYRD